MRFYDYLTEFIFVENQPEPVEIIFVPGGPYPDSARYAAKLYQMGYAPYIMPSGKYSILKDQLELPEELWQELELGQRLQNQNVIQHTKGSQQAAAGLSDHAQTGIDIRSQTRTDIVSKDQTRTGIDFRSQIQTGADFRSQMKTECDYLCEVIRQAGVPEHALILENQAAYTYENAIFSRKKLDQLGLTVKKAILCCQAFHARRCLLYYQEQFPDTEFLVCPVVTKGISRDSWYKTKHGIETVLGEVERCGSQFHEIMHQHLEK